MAGGGAPPGQLATYPTPVTDWHTAAVGTPGSLSSGFNLVAALNEARTHNPLSGREPYDPSSTMTGLKAALDNFTDNVENLDSGVDVQGYVDASKEKYDATVNSAAAFDALVAAEDAATEAAYQRRVSGGNVGMWLQGAFMTTQFGIQGMLVASGRASDLARFRAQLDVANLQVRVAAIMDMTRQMIQIDLASIQAQQSSFAAAADYAKMKITATDDYTGQLIEFETKRRLWDFSLLNDGTAMVMGILGTQLTPRALTKGERLAANIGVAVNTGLQFGATAGPGAGILAGLGSLGITALQGAIDAK